MDNKYKYQSNDFDQKGLEAKLEKDNIMLKEQIHRLQETIKNLKYEVPQTEETIDEDCNKNSDKANAFISTIPYKTKESKKSSPSTNQKAKKQGNYNTNNYNTNKLLDREIEANDLMFSFNINSQNRGQEETNNINGNIRNKDDKAFSLKKNGAFNTMDYSSDDFDEKLKTKNDIYEKEILNKNSKSGKCKSKSKENTIKPLNRNASQKIIVKANEGSINKKLNRNNSVSNNINNVTTITKSKEKSQQFLRQYSNMNKKIIEKLQCKTQENSESVEDNNNGKTQRSNVKSNIINKANLSKIKLKLPTKPSNFLLSQNSKRNHTNSCVSSNELNNSEQISLIESLKNEIKRLNVENEKLKEELEEERIMNRKFKDFAQDLMKFYEKSGGKMESSTSKKKQIKSNIYEPEKDV